jgi:TfoX/Sxy family transcriptional regulator of competence genes
VALVRPLLLDGDDPVDEVEETLGPVRGIDGLGVTRFSPMSIGWPAHRESRIAAVAYDEELADRIRDLLGGEPGLTERKMFGGLAFLIGGNMAVAASGQGGVLVRVDPEQSDRLVVTTDARPMVMRGRQMQGWLRVQTDDVRTKRQLARWVRLGATYARSLPPKR